jgi:lipid A 3-O-deacylase
MLFASRFVALGPYRPINMERTTMNFRSVLSGSTALIVVILATLTHPAAAQSTGNEPIMIGPIQVLRDEPSYLEFGAGAFNIQENRDSSTSAEGKVEFRYGKKLWGIGPAVGVLANTQGGLLGYAGFYSDFKYDRFVMTPLAAFAAYHRGGSEDLGGVFEFRLSLTFAYQFDDMSRLGLLVGHISNANIHDKNPSENDLMLTYSIPIR